MNIKFGGRLMTRAQLVLDHPERLPGFSRMNPTTAGRHLSFAISTLSIVVIAASTLFLASFF
ncbi:hypothetical protein FZC33_29360 [Labrys sp. KNU-23]|uniref:hypothetical protein n=1 Tax=Labrys sp. KNU-23 TaxID=2789216 RepID=UPI0011F036A7|nr:hypothetical protein [Labrys sp. KNU-23]QEN90165.1 hypothetical protein FZC33_29360 [Labrys sp. KNU-23]